MGENMIIKNNTEFYHKVPSNDQFCIKFIDFMSNLLQDNYQMIQVSGDAGSGKSTFVQFLVGHLISNKENLSSALWVNAGTPFSYKRLEDNFKDTPEKLTYIKSNIFLTNISSYKKQQHLVNVLTTMENFFPLNAKFLIFDSISRNFRLKLMEFEEIKNKIKLINTFFTEQIYPLQMLASYIKINLILIHEVSYKPNLNKNVKFLHNLFNRIDSITINLSKNSKEEHVFRLKYHNIKLLSYYKLSNNGFEFII